MKLVCCFVALSVLNATAEDAGLSASITRSLAFLAREGDRWMEEKSCNSCHHLPELLWAHREARQRGFAIDAAKYDEWLEWSKDKVKDTKPGVEQAAFMMLALPEAPSEEAIKVIMAGRQTDGTWKPAGQFASMQKRSTQEAQINSSRLFLLALASHDATKAGAVEAYQKAAGVLNKASAPASMETLVFTALGARTFGDAETEQRTIGEIAKKQHDDGGWSWMNDQAQSDALATGQVLYLLNTAGEQKDDAIQRAQRYLLATQCDDGSWLTDITRISKVDRSGPAKAKSFKDATEIYHFWGTAWATLGLLHGVPMKSSP